MLYDCITETWELPVHQIVIDGGVGGDDGGDGDNDSKTNNKSNNTMK